VTKRRSSTDQSLSGDEAVGKQGGSVSLAKRSAARGAGTSYNRFNLLPLVNLDAQVTQKSSSDEAEDIPLIDPRIKDGTRKRKWKHSKLFPAQCTSSESAEELLRTATQQRSQDSYKMSKKAGDWTAKEWAMILGIKWPIKDINHMEFLPTNTGASTICIGKTKKQEVSHAGFAEEQKRDFIQQSMTDDSLGWMSPSAWACLLNVKSVFTSKYKALRIPTLLQSLHARAERQVLVDSGSTDNFISHKLLKRMKIGTLDLIHPHVIWNVDGTHNRSGMIKKFADLQVQCGDNVEQMKFLVTDLGDDEIILGYPWLAAFQPKIDWKDAVLDEDMQPLVIKTLGLNSDEEVTKIRTAWCKKAAALATPGEEVFIH
jgi:hypothetical protein